MVKNIGIVQNSNRLACAVGAPDANATSIRENDFVKLIEFFLTIERFSLFVILPDCLKDS